MENIGQEDGRILNRRTNMEKRKTENSTERTSE
jgi:hypothetical protein